MSTPTTVLAWLQAPLDADQLPDLARHGPATGQPGQERAVSRSAEQGSQHALRPPPGQRRITSRTIRRYRELYECSRPQTYRVHQEMRLKRYAGNRSPIFVMEIGYSSTSAREQAVSKGNAKKAPGTIAP